MYQEPEETTLARVGLMITPMMLEAGVEALQAILGTDGIPSTTARVAVMRVYLAVHEAGLIEGNNQGEA